MRRAEVLVRTEWHDAGGVDVVMGDVVVPFDVIEVHRVGDAVDLIEVSQVAEQVRIVRNPAEVALEVAMRRRRTGRA